MLLQQQLILPNLEVETIKILNIISDTNIGGAGKCVLTFLKFYNREQFDVSVVVPTGSLLKEEIEKLNAKCIEVDGISDKSFDISAIRKLKKIISNEKPDVVHAHASLSARIAAKKVKGVKVIYTRHSVFPPSKMISKGIGKKINGFVNNHYSDKIIAVAEAAKKNLTDTGVDERKIKVIKNGVERLDIISNEEKLVLRSNYNVNEGEYLLGMIARLTEVKGHIYALDALKMLLDDGIKVKLLIAGTGPYEEEIRKKIVELNIEQNVIMAGFIKDVTGIKNILDIELNASFGTEATSLSLLEAMSLGVPAVVSDFGGNPGVIYDDVNGYIYPTKDSIAMYEKIKRILTDEKVKSRLKNGACDVFEREFEAKIMTKNIENEYISMK